MCSGIVGTTALAVLSLIAAVLGTAAIACQHLGDNLALFAALLLLILVLGGLLVLALVGLGLLVVARSLPILAFPKQRSDDASIWWVRELKKNKQFYQLHHGHATIVAPSLPIFSVKHEHQRSLLDHAYGWRNL